MDYKSQIVEDIKSRVKACEKEKLGIYFNVDLMDVYDFYEDYIEYDEDGEDGWIYFDIHDHTVGQQFCRISDIQNIFSEIFEDTLFCLAQHMLCADEDYENQGSISVIDEDSVNGIEVNEDGYYEYENVSADGYELMFRFCSYDINSYGAGFEYINNFVEFCDQEGISYSMYELMRYFGATHLFDKEYDNAEGDTFYFRKK